MFNVIKLGFFSLMLVSVGCVTAKDYDRVSELLPKADPRITIVGDSSIEKEKRLHYSGAFAKLTVTPKVKGDEYWKPNGVYEAALELNNILPPEFIYRFSKYYGLNRSQGASIGYIHDSDVEERLNDLNQYLITVWALESDSKLGRQFQCMGIFEGNLHQFYILWAGLQSEKNDIGIDADVLEEYYRLKQKLKEECGN